MSHSSGPGIAAPVSWPDLEALLEALARSGRPVVGTRGLRWLGTYLARLVGRPRPWSYRCLVSARNGTLRPGKALRRAVLAALAIVEDQAPVSVGLRPVTVLAPNGANLNGAQVSGEAKACSVPGCLGWFVPNNARRTRCYVCSPPKPRRE